MNNLHKPVLLNEVIDLLKLHSGDKVVDCTLGHGGHALSMLERIGPTGRLIGIDLDKDALAVAKKRLVKYTKQINLVEGTYRDITQIVSETKVNRILIDLGFSSAQIDDPERGFSWRFDSPLDMRFGHDGGKTAYDLVNSLGAEELSDIFRTYGEEPKAWPIAKEIVETRKFGPIKTTIELAEIVESVKHQKRGDKIHPATLVFQALRIAVNDEWGAIQEFLPQAVSLLEKGGRLAVITFHSGEDRLVKQYFQKEAKDCICPPELPVCRCGHKATITLITKKPVEPSEDEVKDNPRARSAKLRVVQKL